MCRDKIEIVRYSSELKKIWDEFVEKSKNGTFLFKRDYMDYHSDRFHDNSFLIYRKGQLYALFPANLKEGVLYSHQGLTYGGLIMCDSCTAEGVLETFRVLTEECKARNIRELIYKAVPYIYAAQPSQEDLYALFRANASLSVRNISTTINLHNRLKLSRGRKDALRKALKRSIAVKECDLISEFWEILSSNLHDRYGAMPVHTASEMQLLKSRFPENIKLYAVFSEDEKMIGGIVCYITPSVFHTQYISASASGKEAGAIDLILNTLLNDIIPEEFPDIKYLDFGTSCEDGGRYLNESLIYQKEGFGGRAVCYDTYNLQL